MHKAFSEIAKAKKKPLPKTGRESGYPKEGPIGHQSFLRAMTDVSAILHVRAQIITLSVPRVTNECLMNECAAIDTVNVN